MIFAPLDAYSWSLPYGYYIHGTNGLERFRRDLFAAENPRFYTVVERSQNPRAKSARLNGVVKATINYLGHDPRCSDATALRRLVDLIEARLLVFEINADPHLLTSVPYEVEATVLSESNMNPSVVETMASTGYLGHIDDPSTFGRASSEEMNYTLRRIFDDATSKSVNKIDWIEWNAPGDFSRGLDRHSCYNGERILMNRTIKS
jgi:hypothetical protein